MGRGSRLPVPGDRVIGGRVRSGEWRPDPPLRSRRVPDLVVVVRRLVLRSRSLLGVSRPSCPSSAVPTPWSPQVQNSWGDGRVGNPVHRGLTADCTPVGRDRGSGGFPAPNPTYLHTHGTLPPSRTGSEVSGETGVPEETNVFVDLAVDLKPFRVHPPPTEKVPDLGRDGTSRWGSDPYGLRLPGRVGTGRGSRVWV